MKVAIKVILLLGLFAYLVFAFVKLTKKEHEVICQNLRIEVVDDDQADFVSVEDIRTLLNDSKLNPVGKNIEDVSLGKIKKAVDRHQFVLRSLCYATPKGDVVIEVSQKLPIFRVMPEVGEGFYIDANGNKIPHVQYPADVIVVTGAVNYPKMKPVLSTFGNIIMEDKFWNDMIEQIHFLHNGKVEMTPRIGNHIVALGKPQDLALKLARLKRLYEKVINVVGWEKYSRISMEYNNQAVCTKRPKENKK